MYHSTSSFRLPWLMLLCVGVLMGLGALAIARCEDFRGLSGRYVHQQCLWASISLALMATVAWLGTRRLSALAYPCYLFAVALLLVVFATSPINGSYRWIRVGPLGFQPSEFAKFAAVLALARFLADRPIPQTWFRLLPPLILALVAAVLVMREPDLGTAILFLPVLALMLWAAGVSAANFLRLAMLGVLLLPLLYSQLSAEQRSRISAYFQQSVGGQRPTEDGYQLHQAKQMLALGGVWGSWLTAGRLEDPADYLLPEAQSDFIACVVGERYGLWGVALLLILFAMVLLQGLRIVHRAADPFARLASVGVVALLAAEVTVNTWMSVGLLPVTGVSLPLVSYGGSGLVTHGAAIGLLIATARESL